MVTPLLRTGEVCRADVIRQIEAVRGIDGVMPALSTGEGWLLNERQWISMVEYTQQNAGGVPVFAGVELPTTAAVIQRARLAADLGVDGIVVTSPFGETVTQREMREHYEAIINTVGIDLFVYNESVLSHNQTELETLLGILELPHVVGLKESSGSAELARLLRAAGPGIPIFAGWENLLYASSPVDGFVGPLVLLEPDLCRAMVDAPSPALQHAIDVAAQKYSLFDDRWYRFVKLELRRRGVIDSDAIVAEVAPLHV